MQILDVLKKVFNDIHTCHDNKTFDWIRCWGSASTFLYCVNSLIDTLHNHMFSFSNFSSGISIMFAAICGGALIKKDTEPKGENTAENIDKKELDG